jgi:hypothetical protein
VPYVRMKMRRFSFVLPRIFIFQMEIFISIRVHSLLSGRSFDLDSLF